MLLAARAKIMLSLGNMYIFVEIIKAVGIVLKIDMASFELKNSVSFGL